MRLERISQSATVVHFKDGKQVLFSYETPVAAYLPPVSYGMQGAPRLVKTCGFHSRTTGKHIGVWIKSTFGAKARAEAVNDSELHELIREV